MQNLFLLPTEKPSRLFKFANQLHLDTIPKDYYKKYNIYITSDEEIKEDDWGLSKLNEVILFGRSYNEKFYKKIILTTDQDLIAHGIQAIDDEFLEWFVQNPSCEWVEVDKNWNYPLDKSWEYKLRIIPQEKPKQYTNEELEVVINDPLINIIQLPFNLFDNFNQRGELILKAKDKGKIIQVRSVFLQGLFFLDPKLLKGNLVELVNDLNFLNEIVSDFDISMSDLCLQYVLNFKEIDQIIIGVDSIEQLISNINAFKGKINSEIFDRVNSIYIRNNSLLYPYNWK